MYENCVRCSYVSLWKRWPRDPSTTSTFLPSRLFLISRIWPDKNLDTFIAACRRRKYFLFIMKNMEKNIGRIFLLSKGYIINKFFRYSILSYFYHFVILYLAISFKMKRQIYKILFVHHGKYGNKAKFFYHLKGYIINVFFRYSILSYFYHFFFLYLAISFTMERHL